MIRPTQLDVARKAGVSRATVSYVINNRPDRQVPISKETRLRVLEVVEELGYEPDTRAQALRSGGTKTLGLIIPDIRNPHFVETVDGVEREARASGYHLLFSNLGLNNEYGDEIFRDLLGQRIDGLILMGGIIYQSVVAKNALNRLLKRRLSIVEITDRSDISYQVDLVISDYRQATGEVMSHLLSLGHKRIGIILGVARPAMAVDRLDPYQESLRAAGLPVDPALIAECGPAIEEGYQAALRLLKLPSRPTALIAINDLLALGALRAAADLGLRISEDLSLVGFDDIFVDTYLVPRLTSVSKDTVDIGREAVRLVLERIQNPDRPRQIVNRAARFIPRESTGPAPNS